MKISPRPALPKARRTASARHKEDRAFTIIELLVVVGILVVLASLLLPTLAQAMETSKRTTALSNMKQLTVLMLEYMNNNNGISPEQGSSSSESWSSITGSSNYWYNALPRFGGMKGAADYATGLAGERLFYSRDNLLYCPGAVYPSTNYEAPFFAFTMNSKLITGSATTIPLMAIPEPSRTVAFLENGLPGEQPFSSSETKYNGTQAYTYASRFVARYHNHTLGIVSFFDGHSAILNGDEVVCTNGTLGTVGKAYFPPQDSPGPQLIWTPSGTNPNN